MFMKLVTTGTLLCACALATVGGVVRADNINTSGVVCRNYNSEDVLDIDYLMNGVRNVNANARDVICAMPRSPFSSATTPQYFYIDGYNSGGVTTECRLITYTYGGAITYWPPFIEPAPGVIQWDHLVTLPPGSVGTYDYASVLCTIPGLSRGVIYGVTAVQQ